MSTIFRYELPVESTGWTIGSGMQANFAWEYEDGRTRLLNLYETAKRQQWNASDRIDWSQELDPENPQQFDDRVVPIFGSDIWNRMSEKDRIQVRVHTQAHSVSQFLHGEQGALMVAARLVQAAPDMDAKFYASTQVMDEARHVEAFSKLLQKFDVVYPITPGLKSLLENILSDSRWDFCYLGMQVLIEGLALAAFQHTRDFARNPLASSVNAYVMQDEARHVAFGRFVLRDLYPQLTQAERDEREDFVTEACWQMRDRFDRREVWEHLGLPMKELAALTLVSENIRLFRQRLFSRIVPVIRDIGLWSPKVRQAFVDMDAIQFADVDVDALLERDQNVAEEFDARRHVQQTIAAAGAAAN